MINAILAFDATIAGKSTPHTDSFTGSVARSQIDVPASAGGKKLVVILTVHVGAASASRHARFSVRAAPEPSLAVEDASVAEGNAGTTALSFPLTLSSASATRVTVYYATEDGTATSGSDFVAERGKVTFAPGETTKSIAVVVDGDAQVEPDETLSIVLSGVHGARIIRATATGTIRNDDAPAPVTPGDYQGATPEGNYVFLTVLPTRQVTGFRTNSLTLNCDRPGHLKGAIDWGSITFAIGNDGSWTGGNSWSGSEVQGDEEFTEVDWKVSGQFTSASSISGSIYLRNDVNIKGNHYSCASTTPFTVTLRP